MRARDVMTTAVVTVHPETTVQEVAAILATRGFSALPVIDADGLLLGVVAEADLVRDRFPRDARSLRRGAEPVTPQVPTRVGEVMTAPAFAMSEGTDLADLTTAVLDEHRASVPIVDGSRLVGIVTRRDLVRLVG